MNLENSTFPKDIKNLYTFTKLYHDEKKNNYFNGWSIYDPISEFSREGVTEDNNLGLRFCYANKDFKLCETYPEFLIEPTKMSDDDLIQASIEQKIDCLLWHIIIIIKILMMKNVFLQFGVHLKIKQDLWARKNESDINLITYIKGMSKNFIYI